MKLRARRRTGSVERGWLVDGLAQHRLPGGRLLTLAGSKRPELSGEFGDIVASVGREHGVVAAAGYLDDRAVDRLKASPSVARVDDLRDSLTGLLFDVGGFGVERPGLTVNDRYWELFLAD